MARRINRRGGKSQLSSSITLILVGILIIIIWGNLVILQCDRPLSTPVACQLTSANLLRQAITLIPPGHLQGAEVQRRHKRRSLNNTYRVILLTKEDRIPLTQGYSMGERKKQEKANQINAFVENTQQISLTIRQDDRWLGYSFGGMFIVAGVFTLVNFLKC
ncbi:hypothetical protein [Coleofasciculus sp. E2-BRE-01]|uniref:hypothetical protein n=1 Tax=Coleofasciculus sp. E2-BRE-01 TaxID=3069524 RepID=UPI0032F1BD5F